MMLYIYRAFDTQSYHEDLLSHIVRLNQEKVFPKSRYSSMDKQLEKHRTTVCEFFKRCLLQDLQSQGVGQIWVPFDPEILTRD